MVDGHGSSLRADANSFSEDMASPKLVNLVTLFRTHLDIPANKRNMLNAYHTSAREKRRVEWPLQLQCLKFHSRFSTIKGSDRSLVFFSVNCILILFEKSLKTRLDPKSSLLS